MGNALRSRTMRVALAIGLLATLAGCVVYPAGGPYWHHHPYYGYRYYR